MFENDNSPKFKRRNLNLTKKFAVKFLISCKLNLKFNG